ncbi:MAG: CatA-like O-acetyltransferase [Acidobacteriota bacterium]
MFTEFDIDTWLRRSTYEFFKDYEDPFFNFTANIDVTRLYRFCKQNELAFSASALFCTQTAANGIREFRIRQLGQRLVEFDRIHATQTILNENETYSFCYFEWQDDIFEFNRTAKASLEKYKALQTFDVESDRIDLIYYSVIPWVSFTSFKHATRLDNTQTIPRIVFGKMFDDGDSRKMPLSVEANHRIMDGFHVGKLFTEVQRIADSL